MFGAELITKFRELINQSNSIGICVHVDPDGDCLGAALGLGTYLSNSGKKIQYFVPNKISCLFSFLPEISLFQEHIPSTYTPDLRISVDTSTPERSPLRDRATKQPIINVDHHPSNAPRGTVYLINDTISSCCELITFLLQSNDPNRITPQIATFLLMGVSTDTGHFQRGKDLATTFATASMLLNAGADLPMLVNQLYRSNDFGGTQFVGELLQRLEHDKGLIWGSFDQSELEKNNLDEAKIELFLYTMTSIKHDGIFLLFKKYTKPDGSYLKCSFRTKNPDLDVSILAQEFGGGGHRAAAGCRVFGEDLSKIQQQILDTARSSIT